MYYIHGIGKYKEAYTSESEPNYKNQDIKQRLPNIDVIKRINDATI